MLHVIHEIVTHLITSSTTSDQVLVTSHSTSTDVDATNRILGDVQQVDATASPSAEFVENYGQVTHGSNIGKVYEHVQQPDNQNKPFAPTSSYKFFQLLMNMEKILHSWLNSFPSLSPCTNGEVLCAFRKVGDKTIATGNSDIKAYSAETFFVVSRVMECKVESFLTLMQLQTQ